MAVACLILHIKGMKAEHTFTLDSTQLREINDLDKVMLIGVGVLVNLNDVLGRQRKGSVGISNGVWNARKHERGCRCDAEAV